jgi:hypothetical protein
VPFDFSGIRGGVIYPFHGKEEAVSVTLKRLRSDIFVILQKVETPPQPFIYNSSVVLSR